MEDEHQLVEREALDCSAADSIDVMPAYSVRVFPQTDGGRR